MSYYSQFYNKVNRCLARYSPRATTTNHQGTKWMATYGSETSFLLIFSARDDLVKVSWKSDARKYQNKLSLLTLTSWVKGTSPFSRTLRRRSAYWVFMEVKLIYTSTFASKKSSEIFLMPWLGSCPTFAMKNQACRGSPNIRDQDILCDKMSNK